MVGAIIEANAIRRVIGLVLAAAAAAAPDAIISLYGTGIAADRPVIRDAQQTERDAAVFYNSASQINLHLPPATVTGPARIILNQRNGATQSATVNVSNVAPFVFAVVPETSYATIYATGIRRGGRTTVTANGVNLPVLYAGPQPQFPGLDQINVELPRNVRPADVSFVVTTDGVESNRMSPLREIPNSQGRQRE